MKKRSLRPAFVSVAVRGALVGVLVRPLSCGAGLTGDGVYRTAGAQRRRASPHAS